VSSSVHAPVVAAALAYEQSLHRHAAYGTGTYNYYGLPIRGDTSSNTPTFSSPASSLTHAMGAASSSASATQYPQRHAQQHQQYQQMRPAQSASQYPQQLQYQYQQPPQL
jgi:hypothetical protein